VKKALSQLIITMASHDYLSLEGGTSAIEFVATNSALTDAEIQASLKKEKVTQHPVPLAECVLILVLFFLSPFEESGRGR